MIQEELSETVIRGGIAIFEYIYNAPGTTLGEIRYNMFARKAAAGLIKPETTSNRRGSCTAFSSCLSPNPGLDAAAKHAFEPR